MHRSKPMVDLVRGQRKDFLQLWHDNGIGREVLLPGVESALRDLGCRVTRDDGWRSYDLRIGRGRWVCCDLVTVTEYHENGATLTRVRAIAQPTRPAVVTVLVGAAALSAATLAGGFASLVVPVIATWSVLCGAWIFREVCLIRGLLCRMIQEAGRSLGLSVINA